MESQLRAVFAADAVSAGGGGVVNDRSCDVVVATRNRIDRLRGCLDGLRVQTLSNFRVIVVDDCSDSPIADLLTGDDLAGIDVTVIALSQPSGPAAARNAGVESSDADFVVFIDDDVVPNRHFLEAHLSTATMGVGGKPVVSCGPFVQPADWDPTPWNLWEARQMRKEADNLASGRFPVSWRSFHTGNNCVPRAVFNELGGFDVAFKRAEDDEFALRLHKYGCAFRYEPAAIAWHYANRSLEAWLAIPRAYAYYDVEIDRQNPELGYLAQKKAELGRRRLPLRAVRRLCRGPRRTAVGVRVSIVAAQLVYRLGAVHWAMALFSIAYDLSYVESLRVSESALTGKGGVDADRR